MLASFNDLPAEITRMIFSYLSRKDLYMVGQTSKEKNFKIAIDILSNEIKKYKVRMVSSGSICMLAINNEVFTCGEYDRWTQREPKHSVDDYQEKIFTPVAHIIGNIISIGGSNQNLFVHTDHGLYVYGDMCKNNNFKQNYYQNSVEYKFIFIPIVDLPKKIQQIHLGNENVVILAEDKLYVCGDNNFGQLGLGDWEPRDTFTLISDLSKVLQVGVGWNHMIVWTENGLLKCGYDQSGFVKESKKEKSNFCILTSVDDIKSKIIKVSARENKSYIYTNNGWLINDKSKDNNSNNHNRFVSLSYADLPYDFEEIISGSYLKTDDDLYCIDYNSDYDEVAIPLNLKHLPGEVLEIVRSNEETIILTTYGVYNFTRDFTFCENVHTPNELKQFFSFNRFLDLAQGILNENLSVNNSDPLALINKMSNANKPSHLKRSLDELKGERETMAQETKKTIDENKQLKEKIQVLRNQLTETLTERLMKIPDIKEKLCLDNQYVQNLIDHLMKNCDNLASEIEKITDLPPSKKQKVSLKDDTSNIVDNSEHQFLL